MSETDAYNGQTLYGYNRNWELIKETNALGNDTDYTYNKNGALTSVKTPLGNTTHYDYDFMGNQIAVVDARENRTEYTYDGNGNVTSVKDALNKTAYYAYDALGRQTSYTDFNGNVTAYSYNDVTDIQTVTTPEGVVRTVKYDGNGNEKQVRDTNNIIIKTTEYDWNNKPTKIIDALGYYVTYSYNGLGNLKSYTTARGNTYNYTYDANGNMMTETDPLNGVVSYGYNGFNTVSSFTDANENETQYSYDLLDRLTSETDAANNSDSYSYDAISRLTAYSNKRGQNISYSYDADNRKTARTTVEGETAYTYDENNNLLTVSDNNGTIIRDYDELNRVVSYTNTAGQTIGYDYDEQGNLTRLTYPGNKVVVYSYNADNQMTKVKDWNNRITSYTYDENGRLKTTSRPDGSVETYTYNAAGQITHTIDQNGNTVINEYTYSYDADGNIINEVSANEPNVDEISVDDAAMSYSAANRLTNFNGTSIPYDADGNMLKTPLGSEFGNLTFDSLNQLTDVTISGSAISCSYTYDAEGYRTSKTENGIKTNFVVDPNAELSRVLMSTTGTETTYYVYGLGLISQEKGADYRLYHYDYRGSTTAMTTLGGAVVDTMFYDAYGNMVKRTGADKTPFLYVGKYGVETDNNGLYYMRARYYNPQIQRFINVDPIRDGENWYGYCGRNPLINIDVSGLEFIVVSGGKYAIKEHGGYDYNFIEPAIKYFIELRDKNKDEDISWCIANEGWSAEDWQRFEDIASSYNVDIIVINSSQDLLNYINYKNIAGITDEGRNYRDEDQIKKFCVFAHGNAKKLLLGYNYDDANYNVSLNFNMEMIDNVRAEAFDNPNSWFNSCNAATGGKNSFLYKWHTKVGGFSGGYADFTLYYYIMYPQNYRNAVLDYNISKEIKEKRKDYGFSKTGSKRYPIGENNSKPVIYK